MGRSKRKNKRKSGKHKTERFPDLLGASRSPGGGTAAVSESTGPAVAGVRSVLERHTPALVEKLDNGTPREREIACRTVGTFAASGMGVAAAGSTALVERLKTRLFDSAVEVQEASAGALRNLAAVGVEAAEALVAQDVVAGALLALSRVYGDLGGGTAAEVAARVATVEHLLVTVTALCEASAGATEAALQTGHVQSLAALVVDEDTPGRVTEEALKCLVTCADGNPELTAALLGDPGMEGWLTGAVSTVWQENGLDEEPDLTVPVLCCALMAGDPNHGFLEMIVSVLVECAVGSGAGALSTLLDANPRSAAAQEAMQTALQTWERRMHVQRVALEVLSNLVTVPGPTMEEWQEAAYITEDEARAMLAAEEGAMGAAAAVLALLDAGSLVERLLECCVVAPSQAQANAAGGWRRDAVAQFHTNVDRVLGLLGNTLMCVLASAGASEDTAAATSAVWGHVCSVVVDTAATGMSHPLLGAAAGAAAAVARAWTMSGGSPSLLAMTVEQTHALLAVAADAVAAEARANATCVCGLLGGTQVLAPAMADVGALLVRQYNDADVRVVVEAVNATFELFGETEWDAVVAETSMLRRLAQLKPRLNDAQDTAIAAMDEPLIAAVDEVLLNLDRFIAYKKNSAASS